MVTFLLLADETIVYVEADIWDPDRCNNHGLILVGKGVLHLQRGPSGRSIEPGGKLQSGKDIFLPGGYETVIRRLGGNLFQWIDRPGVVDTGIAKLPGRETSGEDDFAQMSPLCQTYFGTEKFIADLRRSKGKGSQKTENKTNINWLISIY